MVHKLVNKSFGEKVTETDLIVAKELVRQRFVVGLMTEMEESVRRFHVVLGLDGEKGREKECMEEFFGKKEGEEEEETTKVEGEEKTLANTDNKNSNKHPKVRYSLEFQACVCKIMSFTILKYEPSCLSIIFTCSSTRIVPSTRPSRNEILSI